MFRVWQDYIRSKEGRLALNAGVPSFHWVAEEQAKWPMYDLAGFYVPEGATPEVISIHPTVGTDVPEYEVVTRFSVTDSVAAQFPQTLVTIVVSAVQPGDRWLLANVLPRRTKSWHTETVGQITYFIEPGLAFDRPRALRAVAFIDSVAAAFDVPPLVSLDYYLVSTVDAALQAVGVEYPTTFGPGGGFAKPVNRQVFAAVPAWGEEYRHELVHLVLRPLVRAPTMTVVASEGIATWLGGTAGMNFRQAVQALRQHLSQRPHLTLDSALAPRGLPQNETYAAGGVLCEMLYRQGGVPALKQFLLSGPGHAQIRSALENLLRRPWADVLVDWRTTVDRLAGAVAPPPEMHSQLPAAR